MRAKVVNITCRATPNCKIATFMAMIVLDMSLFVTGHCIKLAARGMLTQLSASSSAYIDPKIVVQGRDEGPLARFTFAVKDMYDVWHFFPLSTSRFLGSFMRLEWHAQCWICKLTV